MTVLEEFDWRREYFEGAKAAGRQLITADEDWWMDPPSPHKPGWEDDAWKAGWLAGMAGRAAIAFAPKLGWEI